MFPAPRPRKCHSMGITPPAQGRNGPLPKADAPHRRAGSFRFVLAAAELRNKVCTVLTPRTCSSPFAWSLLALPLWERLLAFARCPVVRTAAPPTPTDAPSPADVSAGAPERRRAASRNRRSRPTRWGDPAPPKRSAVVPDRPRPSRPVSPPCSLPEPPPGCRRKPASRAAPGFAPLHASIAGGNPGIRCSPYRNLSADKKAAAGCSSPPRCVSGGGVRSNWFPVAKNQPKEHEAIFTSDLGRTIDAGAGPPPRACVCSHASPWSRAGPEARQAWVSVSSTRRTGERGGVQAAVAGWQTIACELCHYRNYGKLMHTTRPQGDFWADPKKVFPHAWLSPCSPLHPAGPERRAGAEAFYVPDSGDVYQHANFPRQSRP